jgi:predicted phosphodiesterase
MVDWAARGKIRSVLACLYDVHGNLAALDAVLADAREQGAERFLLGGDYALFGGWPAETVARLRELEPAVWIRGNVDRWSADPGSLPADDGIHAAIAFCRGELGEALVEELGALPESATEGDTLVVHASPAGDTRGFSAEPSGEDAALLATAGAGARRVLCGHTHLQFRRAAADGVEVVNPGSVGIPLDGDQRAAYALIHPDGTLELRRVAYDHAAAIARVREAAAGAEWGDTIAGRLERARP